MVGNVYSEVDRIMRVLLYSAISAVIVSLGLVGILALGREMVLFVASWQLRNELRNLSSIAQQPNAFINQCRAKGAIEGGLGTLQIRFLDESRYVVEVECEEFPLDPIVASQGKFWPLVIKGTGSAGIVYGMPRSGVAVGMLGRWWTVGNEAEQSFMVPWREVQLGVSPASTCEGYGYQCCQPDVAFGQGATYPQANDCSRDCYQRCQARPLILALSSDPFPDAQRTVQVRPQETVTFSFIASHTKDRTIQATVQYGDGASEEVTGLQGTVTHAYACALSRCEFEMTVTLRDDLDLVSAATPISRLKVVVQP
jgi:hypothetical protein